MGTRRASPIPAIDHTCVFPLTPHEWGRAVTALKLTRQQTRIVELILRGMRDKQIAAALELSEATVRTHLTRLFARLRIDDRVQLVLCTLAYGRHLGDGPSSSKSITS